MVIRVSRSDRAVLLSAALLAMLACTRTPVGRPPATPSEPTGITNGGYNTAYEFRATTTDHDTDSVAIRFSWGDGTTSDWSEWIASGETVAQSHPWSNAGSYKVQAQAKNRPGLLSDWSTALAVSIVTSRPPATPATPAGPTHTRKDSGCTYTTTASDPEDDSVSYRFTWGSGDTSDWTASAQSGTPGAWSHAWGRSGSYAVRAQARDVNGAWSEWSGALAVTVFNAYSPGSPDAPSGPLSAHPGDICLFKSTAIDPGGDSVSIRFAWGDGDTSAWTSPVPSGSPASQTHSWQSTGDFPVCAQARNMSDSLSVWSSPGIISLSPAVKWKYRVGGVRDCSSPAVGTDGTVFVGSRDSCVYALDPAGTLRWRYRTRDAAASSPAIGPDGTVYVASSDGVVYALRGDGTLKWSYATGHAVALCPALGSDGTIYVGASDSFLYALNPDSTLKWTCGASATVLSAPAIGPDGTAYFGSADYCLYAVNPDGTLKWRYETADSVLSSPAIGSDGTVYFGSGDNYLYALNPDSTLKWRFRTDGKVRSSPVIGSDGTVFVGSADNCLYALNQDGTLRWRYVTGGKIGASPAVCSDGKVLVGSEDCWLYALAPGGSIEWRFLADDCLYASVTAGADGTIYAVSCDGYLYAINGSSQLASTAWPKFHHDSKNTGRMGGGR